jgi:hypothetical protein
MSGDEGEDPVHTTSKKNSFKKAKSGVLGRRGRSKNKFVDAEVEANEIANPSEKKRLRKKPDQSDIVFVDDDDDDDDDDDEVMIEDDEAVIEDDGVALPPTPKKVTSKARKKRAPDATGVSPKTPDQLVVDSKGKNYQAIDGFVRININKLLFRQVITERLKLDLKNKLYSDGKQLTTKHFECLVPSTDPAHRKFRLIGDNFWEAC